MFFVLNKAALSKLIAETVAILLVLVATVDILYRYMFGGSMMKEGSYQQVSNSDWADVEGGDTPAPQLSPQSKTQRSPPSASGSISPSKPVHSGPRTIRTRRKLRWKPAVEEVVGFALHTSDYDRTVIQTDKPTATEDVLTWISSALQNNTNVVTKQEKHFFVNNVLSLYDTDFSEYESSLSACVAQFVIREIKLQETARHKLRLCQDTLRNRKCGTDPCADRCHVQLQRLMSTHLHVVDEINPWDSSAFDCRPQQQEYMPHCFAVATPRQIAVH
jgi:hypothetical protein